MDTKLLTDQILNNISLHEYDFVNPDDVRAELQGAYHDKEEKTLVATDGHVMFCSKKLYVEECAGRIVDEDGDLMPEHLRFPRWKAVIPHDDFLKPIEVDMESLAYAVKEMLFPATMTDIPHSVLIHGHLIRVQFAEKMLRFMLLNGTNQILIDKWSEGNRPVMVKAVDEMLMVMPAYDGGSERYANVECKEVNE